MFRDNEICKFIHIETYVDLDYFDNIIGHLLIANRFERVSLIFGNSWVRPFEVFGWNPAAVQVVITKLMIFKIFNQLLIGSILRSACVIYRRHDTHRRIVQYLIFNNSCSLETMIINHVSLHVLFHPMSLIQHLQRSNHRNITHIVCI